MCSADYSIKVWLLNDFKMVINKEEAHDYYINQLIGNEEIILSCSYDTYIKGWIINNNSLIQKQILKMIK